ncbi:MAG: hypothetical protein IJ553_00865 [Alloprevotella sp.]|nr:hypothetical protein [Alloprevotella sp.]
MLWVFSIFPIHRVIDFFHNAINDGERMGVYQIKKNEISFGSDGYRQKIELGRRVD